MTVAILYPRFEHAAIEERYAAGQTRLRLGADRRPLRLYDLDSPAGAVAAGLDAEHALVVTDPLLAPGGDVAAGLLDELVLALAGWAVVEIAPQPELASPGAVDLLRMLAASGQEALAEHVRPPGFYVTARPLS